MHPSIFALLSIVLFYRVENLHEFTCENHPVGDSLRFNQVWLDYFVGTSGGLQVILIGVAGVVIDGAVFGAIYAKTYKLALTWTTHFAADVVGLIALGIIF